MSNVFVHPKVASAEQTSELQLNSQHMIKDQDGYRVLVPNPEAIRILTRLKDYQERRGLADKILERSQA